MIEDESSNSNNKRRLSQHTTLIKKSTNKIDEETGLSRCLHRVRMKLYLSLAPIYINNPIDGLKQQHLDTMLMTFYKPVKGVILSYFNLKVSNEHKSNDFKNSSIVKVSDSNPFCFIWCDVDFLIWKPQIGDIIDGWSYLQTQSHIGLLINDTFNASIKKYNIPNTWKFIPNQIDEFDNNSNNNGNSTVDNINNNNINNNSSKSLGQWVDENEVPIEGKLRFIVKALHTAGKVISIEGTLLKPGSESDSQPVVRDSKHKKFDDLVVTTNINDSIIDDDDKEEFTAPKYINGSDSDDDAEDEDNKIVGGELSSEDEEDSD
ncbi:hypothetical protein CANARDRAFT_204258 [[Candida] arabinofermentans NRRL YB-2248]|uniref:DNA-directed RNA polymerase subunit n=1 Tax=[Candida] arabinofermentans NRRL YB-2248 TaxID=983967 RepID=A0A1E4STR3_9ASCO|nr:hypothetical protein CANARDRAFT_204258 [[Candida] arabinofermentans NRRL YB-2248]